MEESLPMESEIITKNKNSEIDFIEKLLIKKEEKDYEIKLGIIKNKSELVIRVLSIKSEKNFYYQHTYTISDFKKLSKAFSSYANLNDIINFLKNLNFEIEEQNNEMSFEFNIYMPDGKNELIKLNLEKIILDKNNITNYFLENITIFENKIKNIEDKLIKEIDILKEKNEKYQIEISNLKESIITYKKEIKKEAKILLMIISSIIFIFSLIFTYKINSLKVSFKSDVIHDDENESLNKIENEKNDSYNNILNQIDFILKYIRNNDELFNFNDIKLLYNSSIDGDRTKTLHQKCDNKKNVLIIIESDNEYTFGGYTKIGFKSNYESKNMIDNHSFLFSVNLQKIYHAIKGKNVIRNFDENHGLCFTGSLYFYDNFTSRKNYIEKSIKKYFSGFANDYEMNGGKNYFKIKKLEVFQLLLNNNNNE